MPRIPQGRFNTTPGQRVGRADARPVQDASQNLAKGATALTTAFAKIQDQTERTEAHNRANDVKQRYQMAKVEYEFALDNMDADGNFSFQDPMDDNPDPQKRRVIEGNIREKYQDLIGVFQEGQEEIEGIQRSDIGSELLQQYVGDDLVRTQIKTSSHLQRIRMRKTTEDTMQNVEGKVLSLGDLVSSGTTDPSTVQDNVVHVENSIQRELASVRPIVGEDNYKKLLKLKDRAYSRAARDLVGNSMNASSVEAAKNLVANVEDPIQKKLAQRGLERTLKKAATHKPIAFGKKAEDAVSALQSADYMDDTSYQQAITMASDVRNVYLDPQYSTVTEDQMIDKASSVAGAAVAKKYFQENMTESLEFLDNVSLADGRIPASAEGAQLAELEKEIMDELESSGLAEQMRADDSTKQLMVTKTIESLRREKSTLKDRLPAMVQAAHPNMGDAERFVEIQKIAEAQGLGDTYSFAAPKEAKRFRRDFKEIAGKSPEDAMVMFSQHMSQAGTVMEGEQAFRRKLAQDLVGKDDSLAYLIPAAEVNPDMMEMVFEDAANFENNIQETDVTKAQILKSIDDEMPDAIARMSGTNMYKGVRQMVLNRTAALVRGGPGQDSLSKDEALSKAWETVGDSYASFKHDEYGEVFALNRPDSNFDYSERQQEISAGMRRAVSLNAINVGGQMKSLTKKDKVNILNTFGGSVGQGVSADDNDETIDALLRNLVRVRPDPRNANMVNLTIDGNTIALPSGSEYIEERTELKLAVSDLVNLGELEIEETQRERMESGDIMKAQIDRAKERLLGN